MSELCSFSPDPPSMQKNTLRCSLKCISRSYFRPFEAPVYSESGTVCFKTTPSSRDSHPYELRPISLASPYKVLGRAYNPAPPKYPLRCLIYQLAETIRPSIKVHWGYDRIPISSPISNRNLALVSITWTVAHSHEASPSLGSLPLLL